MKLFINKIIKMIAYYALFGKIHYYKRAYYYFRFRNFTQNVPNDFKLYKTTAEGLKAFRESAIGNAEIHINLL